jgi:hypothetical protein
MIVLFLPFIVIATLALVLVVRAIIPPKGL